MKTKFICILLLLAGAISMTRQVTAQGIEKGDVQVVSGGRSYKSYLTAPGSAGPHPAIVMVHSNRGLEEGYKAMSDKLAEEGFVVLALGWQSLEQSPSDLTVKQLIDDGIKFLGERKDVDSKRLGLTGFCAGGRFTMLFLPQISAFKAGVAWYGFPYRGSTPPADFISNLTAPMLIIHGTEDSASPIADIYKYATALREAKKNFELKIYSGEPHGFMLQNGQFRQDEVGKDAFDEMLSYFKRKLA